MALHIVHLAVKALIEPAQEVPFVLGDADPGDPKRAKAQRAGTRGEFTLERAKVDHLGQYNHLMALPTLLYSATQVRALDAHAIDELGIAGYTLMKRAGEAALRYLRTRWPTAHRIAIVCGSGNNGGDGYVLARFAQAAGLTVSVLHAAAVSKLRGDARQAYEDFRASGGQVQPFAAERLDVGELIVDALLGTGVRGAVSEQLAQVIRAINARGLPVFSLDAPSGLDADTGAAGAETVRAEATVTFAGLKTGLFVGDGPEVRAACFSMTWS